MIELPESYVLMDQINKEIRGKKIVKAEANHSPHGFALYSGNPAEYNEKLAGKTIICADIYSGNIRIKADDMILIITTPIRYHKKNAKLPDKHQLYLELWSRISCIRQKYIQNVRCQHYLRKS